MKLQSLKKLKNIFGLWLLLGISSQALAFRLQEIPQLFAHPRSYLLAHPDFMEDQLNSMLTRRCTAYTSEVRNECSKAGDDVIEALEIQPITLEDPKTHDKAQYVVTLTTQLKALHQDPRAIAFLQELDAELGPVEQSIRMYKFIAPQNIKPLDLGDVAFKFFGSRNEALRALAVLFQDLPQSEIQVHYLYQLYGADPFVTLLHRLVGRIAGLEVSNKKTALTLFGNAVYNTRIYHALVPAYLASKLKAKGHGDEVSFITAFLFNYVYEAGEAAGNFRSYFLEPKSLNDVDSQNDIRSGELGALLGIGRKGLILSENEARTLLTQSPKNYLRRLAQSLNPQN